MLFKRKFNFNDISIDDIKKKTRILIIDDESREDVIQYLNKDNWHARQIYDLDSFDSIELKDAHIICIDIKGVGKKLYKLGEGLDLTVSIKKKYPEKKIIQYSSQSTHDWFHEANDYLDKRIHKSSGDLEVFSNSVEELAKNCFNWNDVVLSSFKFAKKSFTQSMRYEDYSAQLRIIMEKNKFMDSEFINKYIPVGANIAQILSLILQMYASWSK